MTNDMINELLLDLSEREESCWLMSSVFLKNRDAHGLHDMGVEIQALQRTIIELNKLKG